MKILFIAPLPPPLAGHSLVAQAFCDELSRYHEVAAVNFNKQSFKDGVDSFKRVFEVLDVLKAVWKKKKNTGAVYLTISESFAGNIKDICIYLICFRKLSRFFIHLHGGTIKRELWDRHTFLIPLNRFFIKRMAGVIISGESHLPIFDGMISRDKIHMVPNFALDYLFVDESHILEKFSQIQPLRILYMSNMIERKGYNDLATAMVQLRPDIKSRVQVDFAGRFETTQQQDNFLQKIAGEPHMRYHGVVDDSAKKALFANAHIFCLPTAFFEGQPVSIPEAYASGCVVVTTGQPGILDIFTPGENGYKIDVRSPESIQLVIEKIIDEREHLLRIAMFNRETAGRTFRMPIYNSALRKIVEGVNNQS